MAAKNTDLDVDGVGAFLDTSGSKHPHRETSSAVEDEFHLHERDEVEERLEGILFGRQPFQPVSSGLESGLHYFSASESDEQSGDERLKGNRSTTSVDVLHRKKPVWHDEDDAQISVDISTHKRSRKLRKTEEETKISGTAYHKRLRTQFEKLSGQPEWVTRRPKAKRKRLLRTDSESSNESESGGYEDDERWSETDDDDEPLLQRTGNLLSASYERLPQGTIDLKRMNDANSAKRAQAVVRSVEFHPTANVILVAGFHKTLDLFQVDGQSNTKLQSVHLQRFPITTAHFSRDGKEVVMAGQKKNFFVYDMMAGKITQIHGIRGRNERFFDKFVVSPDNQLLVFLGKDGYMPLVSNKTKQWVGELKMNGTVRDVAFTADSQYMLSIGSEGKVYVWDMSARDCIHCFTDEGCLLGTKISISPNQRYVACGSDSGVVNVYNSSDCLRASSDTPLTITGDRNPTSELPPLSGNPKPLKSVMNLTTAIDHICFNPTSEMMVIASQRKKDALKILHLSSMTVFSNWPSRKTPLSHVTSLDISPHSKYLAIGNDKGKVLLYRLNHYYKGM